MLWIQIKGEIEPIPGGQGATQEVNDWQTICDLWLRRLGFKYGSAHERLTLLWIQIRGEIEPIPGGRGGTQEVLAHTHHGGARRLQQGCRPLHRKVAQKSRRPITIPMICNVTLLNGV